MRKRKTLQLLKKIFILGVSTMIPMGTLNLPIQAAEPIKAAPTLSVTQRSTDFNDNWTFHLGDLVGAEKVDFDSSAWRQLNLPHDWSIEQDFTTDVAETVGHLAGGTGWYRKAFTLPPEAKDKRVRIEFGGVYMDSFVYVNGQLMGNYPYGYMPFSYDITDQVICDGVTENIIAVKVTNITTPGAQSSRWYSGSGIYRDVHLTVTDAVHVGTYGSVVTTPNIEQEYAGGRVTVNAKTTVHNQGESDVSVVVQNTILNYYDNSVFLQPVKSDAKKIVAGAALDVTQTMTAVNPLLWSTESPNLYTMRTEILVDGKVVDTYDTRFGFRWFNLDNDDGFSLNGQYMKLHGVCMHHDQGALGAVASEAATARQMRIMKEMGANAIRVTHNPASDVLLKQCDEQGLLVIEEAFDTWYYGKNANDYGRFFEKEATHPEAADGITWGQFDLQQMIRRGINCPSIFMWSLGNEVYQSREEKGIETVKNLVKWAKEIDTTRYTTMGEDKFRDNAASSSTTAPYTQIAKEVDVVGFNYGSKRYDEYRALYPDWIMYGSENSSAIKSRGYYSDPEKTNDSQDAALYQLSSYDNRAVGWGATASFALKVDRDRKWVAGQFVWTGFDYIGEPTPYFGQTSIPKSSYFGIVDTAGFAKDDYYLYQSQWLDKKRDPMVHILPHWNWEDETLLNKVTVNGKVPVRVYSNAPTVELFMDGASLGEQSFAVKTTDYGMTYYENPDNGMLYLEWQIPYEYDPGCEIIAVAKDESGKEIARDRIVTAGQAAKLDAHTDRQVISADGKDLAYITVDVTDAAGNFAPTAMNQLYFSIEGDGEIVGVDNGDAASWERYKDTDGVWKRKAFNGKALVIVRSTKESGSFTLTATGAGLTADSVTVYTKAADVEDSAILGYETPSVAVIVGQQPTLPATVTALYADGSSGAVKATWDKVTLPNKPAEIVVTGVAANGDAIKLNLTVRGPVGILDTTLVTGIGQQPTLPDTVTAVWSDGLLEEYPVTWPSIPAADLNKIGLFEITGQVTGLTLPAKARIHVKTASDDVNIALQEAGTVATATYEESNGNHPVREINDGVIDSTNGYGNWNGSNRLSDSVTLTFAKEYEIDGVTAWLTSMNTWQTPGSIRIEYWNGSAFVSVANQSKTSGFGSRTSATEEYNGEDITFTPVTTNRLRLTFSVSGYNGGKDMMKITEVAVWSKGIAADTTASLSTIELDGKSLANFDPDTYLYTVELPYGAEIPQVTAKADSYASVFVRQALTADGAAQIRVTAEDGVTVQNYTVQFMQLPPALTAVTLTAQGTDITEDDYVPLHVSGKLADGSQLNLAKATVTYTVTDLTGHAEMAHGQLVAYDAGDVQVTASVEYLGKMVTSQPLTFHIAKNTKPKKLLSFTAEQIFTKPGQTPTLPDTVTARFEYGPNRALAVEWDTIPAAKLAEFGTFTLNGTVTGYTEKPQITITVRDAWAVEQVSLATPRGMVPDLPATLTAYYTDHTSETVAVKWEVLSESDFDLDVDTVVTVRGEAELGGTKLIAKANIRISEGVKSPNYVAQRNGYMLPIALASYTNDNFIDATGYDRADYLNDGDKSFAMVTGKQIWCNWVNASSQRTSDWVGAVIAYEGQRVLRYVDQMSVGFCQEAGASQLIRTPAKYYVEYYTGPLDFEIYESNGQVARWQNSPLNDDANWREVSYVSKPDPATLDGTSMTDITFKPVKTGLIRVRMEAKAGQCLGVNELEVYGKQAQSHADYQVSAISLDGVNVLDQFKENTLTVRTDDLPEITVTASNNAGVTILQPAENPGKAVITILPENGDELKKQVYTIYFLSGNEMGDVDRNGKVDVADIMKLKSLIMRDQWTDEELAIGDLNDSGKLDVGDIMAVKNIIMNT